jgi:hypothetical protein
MTTTLPAPPPTVDTEVSPRGTLEVLSQREVEQLRLVSDTTRDSPLFQLFQRCALAVLNCGSEEDDAAAIFDRFAAMDAADGLADQRGHRELLDHRQAFGGWERD